MPPMCIKFQRPLTSWGHEPTFSAAELVLWFFFSLRLFFLYLFLFVITKAKVDGDNTIALATDKQKNRRRKKRIVVQRDLFFLCLLLDV